MHLLADPQALRAKVADLSHALEASRDSEAQLQDQIMSLTEQRKALHSENTNLAGEVNSLQQVLGIARRGAKHANTALEETQVGVGVGGGCREKRGHAVLPLCAGMP